MKARVKATGEIVEVAYHGLGVYVDMNKWDEEYNFDEIIILDNGDPDYWTRLEHQYAGMAMNALLLTNNIRNGDLEGMRECNTNAMAIAHALVEKARYKENPKELEGLKKELEALKIEKTILENKIKLLTEESK